jgi:cation diffusion facilitator CzcD-associated flavoprotein CzcO
VDEGTGIAMRCSLLVIGAGPYGLAMAAMAKDLGLDLIVSGRSCEFWQRHTPPGMLLRSGRDWHIDPLATHTFQRYLHEHGGPPPAGEPLTREVLLDYFRWFILEKEIAIVPQRVRRLDRTDDEFLATLDDGRVIAAKLVVAAPGFAPFSFCPPDLTVMLPPGRFSHSCDAVDFARLQGRRCLIVGGRQSAFEWAALLVESGAARLAPADLGSESRASAVFSH